MAKITDKYLDILSNNINELEESYSVKRIGIFGSIAKGKSTSKSDVDIIVEFKKPIGFFKFIDLETFLSGKLKRKVDLATKKALRPTIKNSILETTVYVR